MSKKPILSATLHSDSPPPMDACISALLHNRFVLTLNADYVIQAASDNALDVLALEKRSLSVIPFHKLLHPSHQSVFCDIHTLPLQKRAQLRHRDGNYGWYSLKYHEQVNCHILVLEPINALVQAEKKLRSAQLEVEYSDKERSEFLRHMSHELRTPLNAILGFSEMMECGVFGKIENPSYEEYLTLIRQSGEDLLTKIVDLMDLSAVGSHNVTIRDTEFLSHDMMERVHSTMQKAALDKDVAITLHQSDHSIKLLADRRLLRKAISYMVHNAIQYNRINGTVDIYAGVNMCGDYVIKIEDNGYGIKTSRLRALKLALHDSDNLYSNVEAHHPIGLGLTLCKEYIHLHGGNITIDSSTKKGTIVTLTLPNERVTILSNLDLTQNALAS